MIFGKVVGFPAAALLAGQGGFTGVGAAVWFSGEGCEKRSSRGGRCPWDDLAGPNFAAAAKFYSDANLHQGSEQLGWTLPHVYAKPILL